MIGRKCSPPARREHSCDGVDLGVEHGAGDERVALEVNFADLDLRPLGDVENHARVGRLVTLDQLAGRKRPALFDVEPDDGLAGELVHGRVHGHALADAGHRVQFFGLEVVGSLVDDFLDDARVLQELEMDHDFRGGPRVADGLHLDANVAELAGLVQFLHIVVDEVLAIVGAGTRLDNAHDALTGHEVVAVGQHVLDLELTLQSWR